MILFDLDGTLIDSNSVWLEVDDRFLSAHKLTATEEYLDTVGHSIFPIAAQFTKEYYHLEMSSQEIMDEWLALARDAYEHRIPLKPGVRAFLECEAAKGETLALVTACVPELGHAVLKRLGLSSLFHHFVFAQELGLEKRHPQFFGQVLDLLNTSASDCTLFDDGPDNCAAAKAAGLTVIGILDPFFSGEAGRMQQICDRCITNFEELLV